MWKAPQVFLAAVVLFVIVASVDGWQHWSTTGLKDFLWTVGILTMIGVVGRTIQDVYVWLARWWYGRKADKIEAKDAR